MKSVFKIILLVIISCCYFNSVFEFSDIEKKANFENESHAYVQFDAQKSDISFTKSLKQLDHSFISCPTEITFPIAVNDASGINENKKILQPPKRRYILFASLLI